jgi:hypothetical protein
MKIQSKLQMRTALLWAVTQRVVAILYRRFATTCQFHITRYSLICYLHLAAYFVGRAHEMYHYTMKVAI